MTSLCPAPCCSFARRPSRSRSLRLLDSVTARDLTENRFGSPLNADLLGTDRSVAGEVGSNHDAPLGKKRCGFLDDRFDPNKHGRALRKPA